MTPDEIQTMRIGYESLRAAGAKTKFLPLGLCAVIGRGEECAQLAAVRINAGEYPECE